MDEKEVDGERLRMRWVCPHVGRLCHGAENISATDEEDDELMMYANLKALYSSLASPFLTQPN